MALFGSVVREAARADSDVDVAVLGGEFWDQCGLGSEIGGLLGREPHLPKTGHATTALLRSRQRVRHTRG